jgi:16S rRNA (guanine527-N7)-methyltransferase
MAEAPPPGLLPPIRSKRDLAAAFDLAPETVQRLEIYVATLVLWQKRINLVAPGTLEEVWHRHVADSAQLLVLAPPTATSWVDLGSGAGFPGLVLAILLAGERRSGVHVTLVESDQRKCAFLAEVVRRTGLSAGAAVDILTARIESPATRASMDTADVVSARALAPLERLLGLAAPFLTPTSVGLFPKGRGVEAELTAAGRSWQFAYDVLASRTDAEARIVRVRGQVSAIAEGRDL